MKRITIGILAHVDAGKTTLSEAMLYKSGEIRNYGSVDKGDTVMDSDPVERARGITIYSSIAEFRHKESEITILDTPGHTDFSGETERTLGVLDAAILIISGTDGVQSHTSTLFSLLGKYDIPTFIFVNKMDISNNTRLVVKQDIVKKLEVEPVDMTDPSDDKWMEDAAAVSEPLMDKYIDTGILEKDEVSNLVARRKIVPVIFGSAKNQEGVTRLLDVIDSYVPNQREDEEFGGKVYKILRDDKGERLSFVKVTGGTLKIRQSMENGDKVNGIRKYMGGKYSAVQELKTGEIGAVEGLQKSYPGQGLGNEEDMPEPELKPVISYRILPENKVSSHTLLEALKELEEEDPLLEVNYILKKDEIRVRLMGPIQKEVLNETVKSRYNIKTTFDAGKIEYKETIKNEITGHGHFEPLRHFADVRLRICPAERGSGVSINSELSYDELEENYQNQIIRHIKRGITGILTGSPLTDVTITIVGGASHKKHTSGGDFNKAVEIAIRDAELKAENIILEPVYHIMLEVPVNRMGRALTDIEKMYGKVETPINAGDSTIIEGSVPVSMLGDYAAVLNSYTSGAGKMSVEPAGYTEAHDTKAALEETGYDYRTDPEHPFESIYVHGESNSLVYIRDYDRNGNQSTMPGPDSSLKGQYGKENSKNDGGFSGIGGLEPELRAIFEKTYGTIKSPLDNNKRVLEYTDDAEERDSEQKKEPDKYQIKNQEKLRKKADNNKESYVIVDGYNLIFNWKELRELSNLNLDSARGRLVDILSNYQGYTGCHMLVVFDAYKVKGQPGKKEKYQNVEIAYTGEMQTADSYIEKAVHDITGKDTKNITVVTSDGWVQRIVLGEGALRMSAAEFFDLCSGMR
jgi:ribosomal protection tetracycline resistance protein